MKKNIFLFTLLLGIGFLLVQCSNDDYKTDTADVKRFVQQIKNGTFQQQSAEVDAAGLPLFSVSDIPELLRFAEDNTPIKGFPSLYISSVSSEYYRQSQCLIWIVEKIRIGEYPSLSPRILKKENNEIIEVTDPIEIGLVVQKYKDWWKKVESEQLEMSFGYFSHNPLDGTPYMWQVNN